MGITPIGPLAMLQPSRFAGPALEPPPMGRVERSSRSEDETYSASAEEGESESGSREPPGDQAETEAGDDEFPGIDRDVTSEQRPMDRAAGMGSSFELSGDSSARISFLA